MTVTPHSAHATLVGRMEPAQVATDTSSVYCYMLCHS